VAFKLNKDNFNFGEGSSPSKLVTNILEAEDDARAIKKWWKKDASEKSKDFVENAPKQTLNFLTGMGKAGSFNPFLGEQGIDVQGTVDMVKGDLEMIKNMKAAKKNYWNEKYKQISDKTKALESRTKKLKETNQSKPKEKSSGGKIPKIGTKERKAYYDRKNWKYDDTIKGYNRDGTKK
tara:strand:- start:1797 stop:2333 length:537 start_codon:yes stop_codon:yes gene_type:complete